MSLVVDILIIAFIVLGALAGMKKGLFKSAIGFIGEIAIVIIAYSFRTPIVNFLINKMPFFNFSGSLQGLTALNIVIYNALAFIVLFIILYCILNIVLSVTGFIGTLLKFTVIWVLPSKIGGAVIGALEAWVFIFLALFVCSNFQVTNKYINDSKVGLFMLNHTPIIGTYLNGAKNASIEIYDGIRKLTSNEDYKVEEVNLYILQIELKYHLIDGKTANDLIETDKLKVGDVQFATF